MTGSRKTPTAGAVGLEVRASVAVGEAWAEDDKATSSRAVLARLHRLRRSLHAAQEQPDAVGEEAGGQGEFDKVHRTDSTLLTPSTICLSPLLKASTLKA